MPTKAEMRIRASNDDSFPHIFRQWTKPEIAARLSAYCERFPGHDDIVAMLVGQAPSPLFPRKEGAAKAEPTDGFVYMLKAGRFYKVGRTNDLGRREYDIKLQLPERATTVHTIRTDDPVGIEAYWHKRFAERRKNGEWFELTAVDVKAFRRRKFM